MEPSFATRVVHGLKPADEHYDAALAEMRRDSEVWDIASIYAVQDVIRPEETRDWLCSMLEVHRLRMTGGVGKHLMRAWPTSF